jgi:autotransporter-associated beta strand protein
MLPRLALLLLAALPLHAQTYTWDGDLSGNWNTAGNWLTSPVSGQNSILSFGSSVFTTTSNNLLPTPFVLNSMTFNSSAPAYTMNGNALQFVTNSSGVGPTIDSSSNSNLTINLNVVFGNTTSILGSGIGNINWNGAISGSGGLTINSSRNVFLNNSFNSYTGLTTITNGALILGSGSALKAGNNVMVGANGSLNLGTVSNLSSQALGTITLNTGVLRVGSGSGAFHVNELVSNNGTLNSLGASGFSLRFTGAGAAITASGSSSFDGTANSIVNESSGPLPITVNSGLFGGFLTINMQISNAGINDNFTKLGQGILTLTNPLNSANVQIDAGSVSISNTSALGSGNWTLRNGGAGASLIYNGSANATTNRPFTIGTGGGRFTISPEDRILTFSGVVTESAGPQTVTISGSGNTTAPSGIMLTNTANSMAGAFHVLNHGVLALPSLANSGIAQPAGASSAINGKFLLGDATSNGTLRLTGTNPNYTSDYLIRVMNTGNVVGTIDIVNPTTNLTLTRSVESTFQDQSTLEKRGAGTLTLSLPAATTPFEVGIEVRQGTLALGTDSDRLISNIRVAENAFFNTKGRTNNINQLTINGPRLTLDGGVMLIPSGSNAYYIGRPDDQDAGTYALTMSKGVIDFTGSNDASLFVSGKGIKTLASSNQSVVLGPPSALLVIKDLDIEAGTTPNGIDLDTNVRIFATGQKLGYGTLNIANSDSMLNITHREGAISIFWADTLMNSNVTMAGGTIRYLGFSDALSAQLTFSSAGGTLETPDPSRTLSYDIGTVQGQGPLRKSGLGTLMLTGNNTAAFAGGIDVNEGVLHVAANESLGFLANTIHVSPGGDLRAIESFTTSRKFQLSSGTFSVLTGKTMTFQGADVQGGYLVGNFATSGNTQTKIQGSTIPTSSTLTLAGPTAMINVSQGGIVNVAPFTTHTLIRVTNVSSGRFNTTGTVLVTDFVNNGQLNIVPGALLQSSGSMIVQQGSIFLGGGSITRIGTVASPFGLINLNGQSLEVLGGLIINNGQPTLFAPINAGVAGGVTRVNFNGLAKGLGFYDSVETLNGGQYSPGNSPGSGLVGTFAINPGGTLLFEINDATGVAGPSGAATRGWDKVNVLSAINFTATPNGKFNINVKTLLAPSGDTAGPMDNFNPNQPYSWIIFERIGNAGFVGTFDSNAININTSQFANPINGNFSVQQNGSFISLVYSPVPEPLWTLPGLLLLLFRRRRA